MGDTQSLDVSTDLVDEGHDLVSGVIHAQQDAELLATQAEKLITSTLQVALDDLRHTLQYGIARNVRSRHLRKLSRVAIGAQRSAVESHEGAVADRIDAAVAIGVLGAAVASLSASDVEVLAPVLVACLGGLELTRRANAEPLRLHRMRQRRRLALDAGRR